MLCAASEAFGLDAQLRRAPASQQAERGIEQLGAAHGRRKAAALGPGLSPSHRVDLPIHY
jgi:hypothetical protein